MLQPYMHQLLEKRIILASTSPRRKQILDNIGLKVEVIPSTFEENLDKSKFEHPWDYVKENAAMKALITAKSLLHDKQLPFLVIGADTVVTLDDVIYEKPRSREEAFDMLTRFSCRTHTVYTGLALVTFLEECKDESLSDERRFMIDRFHCGTDVEFEEISPETIWSYIDTGEPMDKAGGYGIQAAGGTLVRGIRGDYFNVMGFPLNLFARHLARLCKGGGSTEDA